MTDLRHMPSPATGAGAIERPTGCVELHRPWTVTVRVGGLVIAEVDCDLDLPFEDGWPQIDEAAFTIRDGGRQLVVTRHSHPALHDLLSSALEHDHDTLTEMYEEAVE